MLDLSVLSIFDPVSLSSTKNSSGEGISFEETLDPYIKSKDADELAKIIQKEAKKSKSDEAEQLKIIERSLAYVRAKGGNDLSSDVYEQLKDKDSSEFIDVFGTADKVPASVEKSNSAKTAWEGIMTGRAYDHIEENKTSIEKDIKSARSEADGDKTLKITDNQALSDLRKELMENGMSSEDADKDISKMLQEANLLEKGESVEIKTESSSSTSSSKDTTKKLEALREELTKKINDKAETAEEARQILEKSVTKFEQLRPSDDDEPEKFYTEQMQKVLDKSEKYNDYSVTANPSLDKIKVDGEKLITTSNTKVFVNPYGEFVNSRGKEYEVTDDKIKVDGKEINIEDIKPSSPDISVFMDEDEKKVQDKAIEASKEYVGDQKLVHEARGDEKALKELDKVEDRLDKTKDALAERRKKEEKEGKEGKDNTLMLIMGLVSAAATIVAALSQGSGKTTTITGGSGYNRQYGYGYGSYASDKYGYNRGYQATVDAAYERSNQYLSSIYDNPVKTRASIMRQNGMAAIQNGVGIYV